MAEAKEATAPAVEKKKELIYKLKQSRLHMGESRIRWWFAVVEEGTPYEELFKPEYWDVHSYKFAIGDMIDCVPDEGSYRAWLEVVGAGVGGIRVEEFYKKDRGKIASPASLTSQYRVKWAGQHHKFRIERISDGNIEASGYASEAEANAWLSANLKALSAAAAKAA